MTSSRAWIPMRPHSNRCGASSVTAAGDAAVGRHSSRNRSKSLYNQPMQQVLSRRMLYVFLALVAIFQTAPSAQQPPQQPPATPPQQQQPPVERAQPIVRRLDIVTTDVYVRDNNGQFVADLKKEEFEVYEDGVKQD